PTTAVHALPEPDELEVGHRAFHTEHEPIVWIAWIVDALLIDQQRLRQGCDLEEAVPVSRRASEPGCIEAEHGADAAHRHLGGEPLEAFSALDVPARLT